MQSYPPVLAGLLCGLPESPAPVQMAQLPTFFWHDLVIPRVVSCTFPLHPLLLHPLLLQLFFVLSETHLP